jgi:hypothetical protein
LTVYALIEYNAGMKSMQYTIRAIPPRLDMVLRQRAQRSGKSLNEVLVETLAIGAGVSSGAVFDDADWFIGNKTLDTSFEESLDWLDSAPKDIR